MKKIVVLCGSPRENGHTEKAIDAYLKGFDSTVEVHQYDAYKLQVAPCIACDYCSKHIGCAIFDDMQALYTAFDQADVIVLASPLYFNSVSSALKKVIDRCQMYWAKKHVHVKQVSGTHKKIGCFIGTAGSKNADFTGATMVAQLFFKAVDADYSENILIDDTDSK